MFDFLDWTIWATFGLSLTGVEVFFDALLPPGN